MIELRQKLYDKAFLNAKLYYDVGYYNSAVTALRNAILKYRKLNREELAYLDRQRAVSLYAATAFLLLQASALSGYSERLLQLYRRISGKQNTAKKPTKCGRG